MTRRLKFAYADPPYIGQAKQYPGGVEVNHRILIGYLDEHFDGWALSLSAPTLAEVLSYCSGKYRTLAWCKRYSPFRPGVAPCYAWEPVIAKPLPRKWRRTKQPPHDWLLSNPGGHGRTGTGKQRILGEKPRVFVEWVLSCCRVERDDEITDVFPGSGAVGEAIDAWRRQCVLPLGVVGGDQ